MLDGPTLYHGFRYLLGRGIIDLEHDRFKVMLVDASYQFDPEHVHRQDVQGEIVGQGYEEGGISLVATSWRRIQDKPYVAAFDAEDAVWPRSSLSARGAILYRDGGGRQPDFLICHQDFRLDIHSTNHEFVVEWNDQGIFVI